MAVVNNFWLRDNKQKLGGAVVYQANGQTLIRQLAPSINNPRTDAQMEQRVKLANLVAFYRASASWMRGAFETKPSNQSDYNAFVSANTANNRVYLTKSQVDSGVAVVAPYQITRGSLGEIVQQAGIDVITTNLALGDLSLAPTTTIAQLSAALISNNNGILEGDQLSIIQYIQNTGTDGNLTITCRPYELILNLSDGRSIDTYLPTDIMTNVQEGQKVIAFDTSEFVGGVAVILSRTQSGRILVSTSAVSLTPGNTIYPAMTSAAQQAEAIRSYGSNTIVFLSSDAASPANSAVETTPRILSISTNGQTYPAGEYAPSSYTNAQVIVVNMSAPIPTEDLGSLQIDAMASDGNSVIANPISVPAGTASVLTYSVDGTKQLTTSDNDRQISVELELGDGSIITQYFKIAGRGVE